MSRDYITMVIGLGRCGTSLMMQCLDYCGLPVHDEWPAYEDADMLTRFNEKEYMDSLIGKVVKHVSPDFCPLMPGYNYRLIHMVRNFRDQAMSQIKMVKTLSQGDQEYAPKLGELQRMAMALAAKTAKFNRDVLGLPGARIHKVEFANLLKNTRSEVDAAVKFAGFNAFTEGIEGMVVKRSPKCQRYLTIEAELSKTVPPWVKT